MFGAITFVYAAVAAADDDDPAVVDGVVPSTAAAAITALAVAILPTPSTLFIYFFDTKRTLGKTIRCFPHLPIPFPVLGVCLSLPAGV